MAAARTVAVDRVLHSLHAYFLRPGRTDLPIVYDVETVRDGGSFSSRRVVARQGGQVIFYLSVRSTRWRTASSTRIRCRSACRRRRTARRSVRSWPRRRAARRRLGAGVGRPRRPLRRRLPAGRRAGRSAPSRAGPGLGPRSSGSLPDDRRLHQAALAYASDLTLLSAGTVPHGRVHRPQRAGGLARPRDVVPPAVPGRRLAALRPGLAVGLQRSGPVHRPAVPARRADLQRRPGRPDPPRCADRERSSRAPLQITDEHGPADPERGLSGSAAEAAG